MRLRHRFFVFDLGMRSWLVCRDSALGNPDMETGVYLEGYDPRLAE